MLKRLVGWFVLLPLCALLVIFALANRQLVVVNFNPFVPAEALTAPGLGVPLFLVIYAVLILGVLFGGVATWFAQGHIRQERRRLGREADRLAREMDSQRRILTQGGIPAMHDPNELVVRG